MIIGMALKEIFKDKTILVDSQEISVQFHFGDQKEFNYWVATKMKSQKYPLIWYVINAPTPLGSGKLKVDSQLILFQGTKSEILNTARYEQTYLKYIEPLYELVNKTLTEHRYVTLLNSGKPIPYKDEPNFGVETNNPLLTSNDFANTTAKQTKSIGIVLVDAKILRLKMEITPKCIISNSSVTPPIVPPTSNTIPCALETRKYYSMLDKFTLLSNNSSVNIKNLTSAEIIDLWLDNANYGNGIGQSGMAKCVEGLTIGDNVYITAFNLTLWPVGSDGYWIIDDSNEFFTYAVIQEGELRNITSRSAPLRTTTAPIDLTAVTPKLIKIINGAITEIIPLPMTGFANE